MKVLLVSPLPPPSGGIATWTKEVVEFFGERKDDVTIRVLNTALTGKRFKIVSNTRSILDEVHRTMTILKELKRMLRVESFDVMHINSSGAQFGMHRDALIAKTAKKHGIPVVLQFRCNVKDQAEYNKISRSGFRKLVKRIDRILVLNGESLIYVKERSNKPIDIIPNFTVMPVLEGYKTINKNLSNAVFVGQVRRDKGIDEIIETAQHFDKILFHLYGTVYAEYKNVSLPCNVILHGNTDKNGVREALDRADVFILPSYTEGFSNALVEAMARGVPCIATNVGANSEMLMMGCGVCVPSRNSTALSQALKSIMAKDVRQEYSKKALQRCKELYTKEHVCGMLVKEWKARGR